MCTPPSCWSHCFIHNIGLSESCTLYSSSVLSVRCPPPLSLTQCCCVCCCTGPGHQRVEPVRDGDPPGAGGEEEAAGGAESETCCLQGPAVRLQVIRAGGSVSRAVSLSCVTGLIQRQADPHTWLTSLPYRELGHSENQKKDNNNWLI